MTPQTFRSSRLLAASLLAVFIAVALASSVPASAQYTCTILPLSGGLNATPAGAISNGQFVGGGGQAVLLNGIGGNPISLDPGFYGSNALAIDGEYQAGNYVYSYYKTKHGVVDIYHAALWHGSDESMLDLHPTGYSFTNGTAYQSEILSASGGRQVGWVLDTADYQHAFLWTGTSASGVNIEPPGYTQTVALAIDNGMIVGGGGAPNGLYDHALLWTNNGAGYIDLDPGIIDFSSEAVGVDAVNNIQVGNLLGLDANDFPVEYAYLWDGTAASATDLNPAGFAQSIAYGARYGKQVGLAANGAGQVHAILWSGSAASAVDLNSYIPAGYNSSAAYSIDADGSIYGVVLSGTDWAAAVPVVWTPTSNKIVSASQSPPANSNGWCNANVTVTLASPYSGKGSSITYSLNGGLPVTVLGHKASVVLRANGTTFVRFTAVDSAGDTTASHQYTVNIDKVAPKTILSFVRPEVTLTASDPGSDRLSTYYILDGGATQVYTAPFAVQNFKHTLEYWSVDLAGNTEAADTATLGDAAPTLKSISPNRALTTSSDITLSLAGTGFNQYSEALWNGSPIPTSYAGPASLTATVPAADVASAGTALISVTNPTPGSGTTVSRTFTIYAYSAAAGTPVNVGTSTFTFHPVTSYSGFTLTGSKVAVKMNGRTLFYNQFGLPIDAATFYAAFGDEAPPGATASVTGVYSNGVIAAWTAQLH